MSSVKETQERFEGIEDRTVWVAWLYIVDRQGRMVPVAGRGRAIVAVR